MSSSSSDTESQSYQSDDSEWNYIPGPYNIEKTSASGENGVKCATQIVITKATSDRMQMNQLLTKTGSQIIAKKANIRRTAQETTTETWRYRRIA